MSPARRASTLPARAEARALTLRTADASSRRNTATSPPNGTKVGSSPPIGSAPSSSVPRRMSIARVLARPAAHHERPRDHAARRRLARIALDDDQSAPQPVAGPVARAAAHEHRAARHAGAFPGQRTSQEVAGIARNHQFATAQAGRGPVTGAAADFQPAARHAPARRASRHRRPAAARRPPFPRPTQSNRSEPPSITMSAASPIATRKTSPTQHGARVVCSGRRSISCSLRRARRCGTSGDTSSRCEGAARNVKRSAVMAGNARHVALACTLTPALVCFAAQALEGEGDVRGHGSKSRRWK